MRKRRALLLILMLSLLGRHAALADDTRNSGLFTYSIKGNGTVSITDYDWKNSTGDIYIPSMLDGYTVTVIGDEAFAYGKQENAQDALIVIPESVTMIGEKAFYNSPISTVSISSAVQSIGKAAFAYCNITQFIVDQNQPYYATIDGVLYDKRNKSLIAQPQKKTISSKIPEGIQSIGEYAFSGMTIGSKNNSELCLTDILPSTLTRVESHAFENCTLYYSTSNNQGLVYYNNTDDGIHLLPDSVKSIGEYAFAGSTFKCASYSIPDFIMIGENVTEFGEHSFYGCRFYDGFDYALQISKSSIDMLGEYAFASPVIFSSGKERTAVSIVLPDEVDEIGESVFFETYPVYISKDAIIRRLGVSAFRNTVVYTETKKEKYQDEIPVSLSLSGKIKTVPTQAFSYRLNDGLNTVEALVLEDGISKIEDSAFSGWTCLREVELPLTLTEIGKNVFSGCDNLKEVVLPESVTKIGDRAFERQYVTLIVKEGSYAALWASENGYNYRYQDAEESLDWLNSDIH